MAELAPNTDRGREDVVALARGRSQHLNVIAAGVWYSTQATN